MIVETQWSQIGWVTMSKRISADSGSKVTESSSTFRGTHCRSTLVFLFVDATLHSRDMQCRVRKSQKWSKIWCLCAPNLGGGPHKCLGHL